VLSFDELRLPADAVLGEIGKGFRYAQVRLAPARLSHCMRWLGSANRAQDIATDYARTRQAFGKTLGEHEGVSFMLADNAMDIHLARLAIWHTAWVLDQGHRASNESSMSKVICSEAIARVADRSLQILGGMGITRDTWSSASSATRGRSGSTTGRTRCTAGRWARGSAAGRCDSAGLDANCSQHTHRPPCRAAPAGSTVTTSEMSFRRRMAEEWPKQ